MAIKEDDDNTRALIILNLANIKSVYLDAQSGNVELARQTLELYGQAYDLAIRLRNWPQAVGILANMLDDSFSSKPELYTLIEKRIQTLNQCDIPQETPLLGFLKNLICCITALHNDRYDQALSAVKAMKSADKTPDTAERFEVEALCLQARILHSMHRDSEAVVAERQAIDLCRRHNIDDALLHVFSTLRHYYAANGNPAEARKYYMAYLELKEDMMTKSNLQNVSTLDFMYQLREVNAQVLKLSQQRHWQNVIITMVVAFALVVSVLLAILYVSFRRVRAKNVILYNKMKSSLLDEMATHKYKGSRLTETDKDQLAKRIDGVLCDKEAICQSDFSLDRLAELVGSSYKEVSQVVNERYGKNFKALLNERRIHEACRRLTDETAYGHLTIEAVAASVGIKSRSHFNTYFKQVTGLSPSVYQKLSKEEKSKQ